LSAAAPPDIQFLDAAVVDAESAAPSGKPCAACATPLEALDRFCPACGTPNPDYRPPMTGKGAAPSPQPPPAGKGSGPAIVDAQLVEPSPLTKHIQCKTCGAEVTTEPSQRSYVCPFCDSTYVQELTPDQTGRQRPEFVIGFTITPEQAQEEFEGRRKQLVAGDSRWRRCRTS
jgi:Zn finger protein HypA/HybF involved in hydrogenase expression